MLVLFLLSSNKQFFDYTTVVLSVSILFCNFFFMHFFALVGNISFFTFSPRLIAISFYAHTISGSEGYVVSEYDTTLLRFNNLFPLILSIEKKKILVQFSVIIFSGVEFEFLFLVYTKNDNNDDTSAGLIVMMMMIGWCRRRQCQKEVTSSSLLLPDTFTHTMFMLYRRIIDQTFFAFSFSHHYITN